MSINIIIDLQDDLKALRERFEEHTATGVTINATGVQVLITDLEAMMVSAKIVEMELSRVTWNLGHFTDQMATLQETTPANENRGQA